MVHPCNYNPNGDPHFFRGAMLLPCSSSCIQIVHFIFPQPMNYLEMVDKFQNTFKSYCIIVSLMFLVICVLWTYN